MSGPKDFAYPSPVDPHAMDSKGLTKRELFAAMALKGLLANPNHRPYDSTRDAEMRFFKSLATKSLSHADALLAQLSKEPGHEGG